MGISIRDAGRRHTSSSQRAVRTRTSWLPANLLRVPNPRKVGEKNKVWDSEPFSSMGRVRVL